MFHRLHARNLNHLVVLSVLLEEANVSRAAKRLGLTQSATSHALATLRAEFSDQLLIRGSRGMVLTDFAKSLGPPLERALVQLQQAVTRRGHFDPRSSIQTFSLSTPDFLTAPLGRELAHRISQKLPRGSFRLEPTRVESLGERLLARELDLAIAPQLALDSAIASTLLYSEPWVTALSADHPLALQLPKRGALSLDQFARLDHVLVSPTGRGTSAVDEQLAALGLTRRIVFRCTAFSTAGAALVGSRLVLTAPRSLFRGLERKVRIFAPPLELTPLNLFLHLERARENTPELSWFTKEVRRAVALLG